MRFRVVGICLFLAVLLRGWICYRYDTAIYVCIYKHKMIMRSISNHARNISGMNFILICSCFAGCACGLQAGVFSCRDESRVYLVVGSSLVCISYVVVL